MVGPYRHLEGLMRVIQALLPLQLLIMGTSWAALHPQTEIVTTQGLRSAKTSTGYVLTIESAGDLLCSADQLFWTGRGWLRAEHLECGDQLYSQEGGWKSLLFPPMPSSFPTHSLSLTPLTFEDREEDRVLWVGPARILCHNDAVVIPILTITLGSGELIWVSGATLAAAATTLGSWWVAQQVTDVANRFGYPDGKVLQLSPSWLREHQHADFQFLNAASWNLHQPVFPLPDELCEEEPVFTFQPLFIPLEELPDSLHTRILGQLEARRAAHVPMDSPHLKSPLRDKN